MQKKKFCEFFFVFFFSHPFIILVLFNYFFLYNILHSVSSRLFPAPFLGQSFFPLFFLFPFGICFHRNQHPLWFFDSFYQFRLSIPSKRFLRSAEPHAILLCPKESQIIDLPTMLLRSYSTTIGRFHLSFFPASVSPKETIEKHFFDLLIDWLIRQCRSRVRDQTYLLISFPLEEMLNSVNSSFVWMLLFF